MQIRFGLRNLVCELPSTLEVLRLHAKSLDLNFNSTKVQMMWARILKHESDYFMRLFERHTQMGGKINLICKEKNLEKILYLGMKNLPS